MDKKSLIIAEPCDASWDAMDGDHQKRFCGSCTKNVHHLSEMTRREAERLLSSDDGLCVRYSHDTGGRVKFAQKRSTATGPVGQTRGAARMVAKAASIAGVLSACAWPIADRSEPILMGAMPMHDVTPKDANSVIPEANAKPEPTPDTVPGESGTWGEPVWEPELIEMGDVAVDLDPLYHQEQLAAEKLSLFHITLEEEELLPCDGTLDVEVDAEVEPGPEPPTVFMGRMPAPEIMMRGGLSRQ